MGDPDILQASYSDFDADGLTNREEYLLGTNPTVADTDGDGVDDYHERMLGSNPLMNDLRPFTEVQAVAGNAFSGTSGQWVAMGESGAVSTDRRGSVDYSFSVPSAQIWAFELNVMPVGTTAGVTVTMDLDIYVDGLWLGTFTMRSLNGAADKLMGLTQSLAAGAHTLRILNRNGSGVRSLEINSVRILRPEGVDLNGDGQPDWLGQKLAEANSVNPLPTESLVSPICVEGHAGLPQAVAVSAGESTFESLEEVNDQWFSNVALRADAPTTIDTRFEAGAVLRSSTVLWKALNIAGATGTTLTIRSGDSLRLTAYPVASQPGQNMITLTMTGPGSVSSQSTVTADAPLAVSFQAPGTYTVAASYSESGMTKTASVTVNAVTASFGLPVLAYVGNTRNWLLPQVGTALALDWDTDVIGFELAAPSTGGRSVQIMPLKAGTHYVVARLNEGGPIVARGTVSGARTYDATQTGDGQIVTTFENGDQLVRDSIVIDGLPPGGYAEVRIFVAGVTFEDGTTVKRLYAADFDANGVANLLFNYPKGTKTSTCHHIYIFDSAGRQVGMMY